jgi:hypothetical protein
MIYNDDYPTCEYTHAKLRVYSDGVLPEEMSAVLNIALTLPRFPGQEG